MRDSAIREALLAGLEDWRQLRTDPGFQCTKADLTVLSVVPNGTFGEDGRLRVGDRIIGVGQGPEGIVVDVRGKTERELRRLLTGRGGSVVRIQVVPAGSDKGRVYAVMRGGKVGAWLEEVVEAVDDNPWRRALREAVAARDTAKMQALARQVEALDQPPGVLDRLGNALQEADLKEEGLALWRQAQQRHPEDFWLNYHLGSYLTEPERPDWAEEAVGYCRAALALRPVAGAYNALGGALYCKGDFDGSMAAYRQVIQRDAKDAGAHSNLGLVLQAKNDLDGAIAEYRRAVQLDPQSALAHDNLGIALLAKRDPEGAIAEHRQAIQLDPQSASAYTNLGIALQAQRNLDGAIVAFRKAISLDPTLAQAHTGLGAALQQKGELDGAIAEHHQAVQLIPSCNDALPFTG